MKKKIDEDSDELRPEYDLKKLKFVGRGIFAKRYRSGTNLVLLEPDVRKAFPDDESVNEALRVIAKVAKQQASSSEDPRSNSSTIIPSAAGRLGLMSQQSTDRPLVFSVVDDDGEKRNHRSLGRGLSARSGSRDR